MIETPWFNWFKSVVVNGEALSLNLSRTNLKLLGIAYVSPVDQTNKVAGL